MSRRIKADQLSAVVDGILAEYGNAVAENIDEITRSVSKAGVKAVRSAARGAVGGTGKYPSGFTSRVETGWFSAQGTIYNQDVPGLPHLLEYGHAMRNGGRVAGRPHIKKVEEELIKQFEQQVRSKL